MIEQTVRCDHCGEVITADRRGLSVTQGSMGPGQPDPDLCPGCSAAYAAFVAWIGDIPTPEDDRGRHRATD